MAAARGGHSGERQDGGARLRSPPPAGSMAGAVPLLLLPLLLPPLLPAGAAPAEGEPSCHGAFDMYFVLDK